ncbi:MAG: hypothetical protein KAR39_12375 [Thermoplasmata archaeon]|nr:hypothetical protein [Thermoplasmata archaeon]
MNVFPIKPPTSNLLALLGVIAIASVEIVALFHGINGTALATSIGAIAGITGYHIKGRTKTG